jgi:hypothetical protein
MENLPRYGTYRGILGSGEPNELQERTESDFRAVPRVHALRNAKMPDDIKSSKALGVYGNHDWRQL